MTFVGPGHRRGAIRNRDRRRQLVDMQGLAIGTITPTDVDLLIDFKNQRFVFGELKSRGAPLEVGQRLALTRLIDLIEKAGKRAILFVVDHDVVDPSADIPADLCTVREIYERGRWAVPTREITLRTAIDLFLDLEPSQQSPTPHPSGRNTDRFNDPKYIAAIEHCNKVLGRG